MRRLTGFLLITGAAMVAHGALPVADRHATVRAQPNQPRTVVFEKFSKKS